jgi:hypothetical protein
MQPGKTSMKPFCTQYGAGKLGFNACCKPLAMIWHALALEATSKTALRLGQMIGGMPVERDLIGGGPGKGCRWRGGPSRGIGAPGVGACMISLAQVSKRLEGGGPVGAGSVTGLLCLVAALVGGLALPGSVVTGRCCRGVVLFGASCVEISLIRRL